MTMRKIKIDDSVIYAISSHCEDVPSQENKANTRKRNASHASKADSTRTVYNETFPKD